MALTYSLAINHMTDFSDDELKVMKGYRPSKGPKGGIEFTSDVSVDSLPDTWDWRILGTPLSEILTQCMAAFKGGGEVHLLR